MLISLKVELTYLSILMHNECSQNNGTYTVESYDLMNDCVIIIVGHSMGGWRVINGLIE